jgi:hypothetical protein
MSYKNAAFKNILQKSNLLLFESDLLFVTLLGLKKQLK